MSDLVLRQAMLPGVQCAKGERCKDAGSVHIGGDMGATEDAAARRLAAGGSGDDIA